MNVKSAENESVFCLEEKRQNCKLLKEALIQKSLESQKLGVSKGEVEKSLAFKKLSVESYEKFIILKSTGL